MISFREGEKIKSSLACPTLDVGDKLTVDDVGVIRIVKKRN